MFNAQYVIIFQISFHLKRNNFDAYSPKNTNLTTQQKLCIRKTFTIHVSSSASEIKLRKIECSICQSRQCFPQTMCR